MLRWVKLTLLVYSVCLFGWIGFQVIFNAVEDSPSQSIGTKARSQRPLHIEELDYTTYVMGKAVSNVKFQQLDVRPRKFGVFRIRSVNELYLKKLRLEVLTAEQTTSDKTSKVEASIGEVLTGSLNGLPQMRNLGRIQQVVVEGLEVLTLASEKRQLESVVRARQAVFDVRRKELTLKHANVEFFSLKRRLTASQLIWDEREKLWVIDKHATLWDHGEKVRLNHVKLNELLELVE
jgi:hypothetical protein